LTNINKVLFSVVLTCIVIGAVPAPVFVSDNPQSIYAADPNDPWNRIFRSLFTRTVMARVSDAFAEGAPFEPFKVRMGSFPIRLSKQKLRRTELGDRAIEPLYPGFFTIDGPAHVLSEPAYSELTTALRQAIAETKTRSPIERALMQSDAWAAYDILHGMRFRTGADVPQLLTLLRQFVRRLALTTDEIKSLRNNYLDAVNGNKLPNLFSNESGWLEIELLPLRMHEDAADYRRATRVFVKPRTRQSEPAQFVESLKHHQHLDQVEAVALVVQNLLLDTSGRAVPSPLFTDVQFRFFKIDPNTGKISAEPQQFELSRRKLLTDPTSGGLVEYLPSSPAYLASAGNDYSFATSINEAEAPVVVPLRTRCTQCHGDRLTVIMTYSIHYIPPVPTTRVLKPLDQERALHVARRKAESEEFKSLIAAP
jgi:hypothetical protein